MRKNRQYKELIRRYLENKSSEAELEVFFDLLRRGKLKKHFNTVLNHETDRRSSGPSIALWAIAATLIGLLSLGGLWYWGKAKPKPPVASIKSQYSNDVQPARNHALLTLANGKVIDLDTTTAAALKEVNLVKSRNGEFEFRKSGDDTAVVYNTISAPRGGAFPFVLEDGTKVWLNAASSLRFPTVFRGGTRQVILDGEAYFEVAGNAGRDFRVNAQGMQVQVLGTHFDINAYSDESSIKTTLLEGSVRVVQGGVNSLLKPGEQARLTSDGSFHVVSSPDTVDLAMAWRNGYFSFDRDNIQTVMRQIARWYDVNVHYEGPVTPAIFGGDLERDLTLVQVLQILEKSQVHFRLKGKELTVLP
jgi:transmembrane sensor